MATKSHRSAVGQTGRGRPSSRRPRRPAHRPKVVPYEAEIAVLAETTAELPSPSRERAINVVAAIVRLFERVWREFLRLGGKSSNSNGARG